MDDSDEGWVEDEDAEVRKRRYREERSTGPMEDGGCRRKEEEIKR